MRLLVRVETADPDELADLREFLEHDPDVRRGGDLRYGPVTDPEHQGVDIAALSLAVSSTLTISGLVIQLLNYRRSGPGKPVVEIERPDGTVVRLASDDPDAVAEVIRKLENGG